MLGVGGDMIALDLRQFQILRIGTSWAHFFTHVIGSDNRYEALLKPQYDVAAALRRL